MGAGKTAHGTSEQTMDRRTDMFEKTIFNLQLFAEGGGDGAGAGASAGTGESAGNGTVGAEGETAKQSVKFVSSRKGRASDPLENVIYGKAAEDLASQNASAKGDAGVTEQTPQTKQQTFEELIKGEYKDEFQKRTQGIINDRFKDYGKLQNTVKSQNEILNLLAEKYGTKAGDLKALQQAMDQDESFYEQEALEKGLSVEQLKELKQLERENARLLEAQKKAETEEQGKQIYANWLSEGEALKAKYGLNDFNLADEIQNPDFMGLLSKGISVEGAYKAVHFDSLLGGAMAKTAGAVRQQMANNIAARNARPRENGVSSQNSAQFKTNVSSLSKADRAEIAKRVARGADIRF